MDISEIRQGIALLPPTAQTKPLLDALLTRLEMVEGSQNNLALAAMQQEIDALKSPPAPSHPMGLCQDSGCADCVETSQELVVQGRGQVESEIDTALEWAGGPVLRDRIAAVVGRWVAEGRPSPKIEPYLDISLE